MSGEHGHGDISNEVGVLRTRVTALEGTVTDLAAALAAHGHDTPPPPPPDPEPEPEPEPGTVPFGSRPTHAAISLTGQSDVVISGHTFRKLGANIIAVRLADCKRITIRDCDFDEVAECVYAVGCEDIVVEDCRYRNIIGPHQRDGSNRANFVQLNGVTRARISRNKGKGGDTEDIVSVYKSSGVIVEDCHFEGTNWTSPSGSGIALGDDGGNGNIARRNILVNPGQVGVFIAGGVNCRIEDNIVIGQQRSKSNVGMYVWNQYPSKACSGHTVNGNRVSWRREDGQPNPYWNSGNCGPVSGSNDLNANLDIEKYRVVL